MYKTPRKAQVQIGETIAVLFVFFILIVIGFIFYGKVIKGNIELEKEELSQLRSIGIAQKIMFLPELQCSQGVVKEAQNCIDTLKLKAAQEIMNRDENKIYYFDMFEFSIISATEIYPSRKPESIVYSNKLVKFKDKFVTNVPVSLYYPETGKYSFGILNIEMYS